MNPQQWPVCSNQPVFSPGDVALVGAGPGDPELLTLRAWRFIQEADVVVYDRLVSETIMCSVPPSVERVYVGKANGKHCVPQNRINELLAELASFGKRVLRLKGGDPFVFGRGAEELEVLLEHGVNCHVVPGVTSASACTAFSGIPLTHRDCAQSVTLVTGHRKKDGKLDLNWSQLASPNQTVVFYMGLSNTEAIVSELLDHGAYANTPWAFIEKGTLPEQKVHRLTLGEAADYAAKHGLKAPTLIVMGDVVNRLPQVELPQPGVYQAPISQPQVKRA